MAARTTRTELTEEWRQRIQAAMILDRLGKHVAGKNKMTSTQIRAAEILLKKAMPDLSSSDVNNHHSGGVKVDGNIKFIRPGN